MPVSPTPTILLSSLTSAAFVPDVAACATAGGTGVDPEQLSADFALQQIDAEGQGLIRNLGPEQVLNIVGQHDHIDRVLRAMKMPFTPVHPTGLTAAVLDKAVVAFVNCQRPFDRNAAARLGAWVAGGGNLITTDWCLGSLIAVAFPGRIIPGDLPTGPSENYPITHIQTGAVGIDKIAKRGPDGTTPVWFVEGSSEVVQRLEGFDTHGGQILAYSALLKERYNHGGIVFTFPWGDGLVTHFVSHLYRQGLSQEEHGTMSAAAVADLGTVDPATADSMRRAGDTFSAGHFRSSTTTMGTVASVVSEGLKRRTRTGGGGTPDPDKK